jgi:hypothetical protein
MCTGGSGPSGITGISATLRAIALGAPKVRQFISSFGGSDFEPLFVGMA